MKKIITFAVLFMIPLALIGGILFNVSSEHEVVESAEVQNISEAVLKWKSVVQSECEKWEITDYVNVILAIMMVETGGSKPDIMQSSESQGWPVNTIDNERDSIKYGVEHFAKTVKATKEKGTDYWSAVGGYNFGTAYIGYVAQHGKTHTLEIAEEYSKNVVAPSLGNSSGQTYSYVNEISKKYGKTYLYLNGGNFFYVEMVKQYLVEGSSGSDPEGGTPSGAPTMQVPAEYKNKLSVRAYNGINYNSSGSYPYGQCTWYVFNRMYQLGKPVDDYMGNGGQWGATAKRLGYQTSNKPKVGWAMSIPGGVAGSSPGYGHVAFVEVVNPDGSVLVSECNVVNPGSGTVSWRVLSASVANSCIYLTP